MSKHNNLVQIPVGHICISAHEYGARLNGLSMNARQIDDLREENGSLQRELKDVKEKNNMLKGELEAAETKIASLEKTVEEKQDRVLFWFQKYNDLADKLNAVKTVKAYAETEKT